MAGHVFRRCTTCGRRTDSADHEPRCDGRRASWAFRIDVTPESSGQRTQRRGGGYPSRRAAERAMREILTKLDTAKYVPASERTLGDFLVTDWLPLQLPPKTSANRYRNKRYAIRRVQPHVGHIRLQQLTAADLEHCYSTLLHTDGASADPDQAYSPATVLQTHGVIRQALQDAVKWGMAERNVADQADPPSNASVRADRRRAMRVWSPTQLADFLEASRSHWLWPMWLLVATTGLRRGELAGIVDDSLDLEAATLSVSWQLVPEEDPSNPGRTRPVHKPLTKSAASSRSVNLDRYTVAELRLWLKGRDEVLDELGILRRDVSRLPACQLGHDATSHEPFAFGWPDGRYLNPDWVSHEFKRLRESAGVPSIRLHDVRHTHASLLLASGEHLKVVQERLGWTTASFMLDTYAHLLPGMQAEAAERFTASLLPRLQRPPVQP